MALAGALVIGATAATATPASATEGWERCPEGLLCLFGDSNYEGLVICFPGNPIGHAHRNDKATSYWNRTNETYSLYEHSNGEGMCRNIEPGHSSPNVGSDWNDKVSSVAPVACR
ncbi:peptidase inhibitor family I36 protein [Streptomyces sp. NPDC001514]